MLTSNKIKKIIFLGLFFLSLCISIFSFTIVSKAQAQCAPGTVFYNNACIPTYLYNQIYQSSNSSTTLTNQNTPYNKSVYEPLAKLPGLGNFKFDDPCPLGRYLNIVINLIIGLIAVMAMVTIVMGGLQYITSELVSGKADGKGKILNAIFGLLIALSSYLVLNTLNPNLLNLCLDGIPKVSIVIGEESGDDTIDSDYAKGKKVYSKNTAVDPDIASATEKLKDGWSISKIIISKDGSMQLEIKKGNLTELTGKTGTGNGLNGYTSNANPGDKKTPLGDFTIGEVRYTPGVAQFNSKGSNMGAAFWGLTGPGATGRGIGIHGNKLGTLSDTNGCIRLTNADILALQPYIKSGIKVTIK